MPQPPASPIGSGTHQGKPPRQDSFESIIRDLQTRIAALESEVSRFGVDGRVFPSAIPFGSTMLITVAFTDPSGTPFDPVTPSIHVIDPTSTLTIYTSLTHVSTGVYSVEVVGGIDGVWVAKGAGNLTDGNPIFTPDISQTVSITVVP